MSDNSGSIVPRNKWHFGNIPGYHCIVTQLFLSGSRPGIRYTAATSLSGERTAGSGNYSFNSKGYKVPDLCWENIAGQLIFIGIKNTRCSGDPNEANI